MRVPRFRASILPTPSARTTNVDETVSVDAHLPAEYAWRSDAAVREIRR
jgi:hypothetical protein